MSRISSAALTRLQTLYHQFEHRSFDVTSSREDRLAWAAETLGHEVTSFSALTIADGKHLIDALQLSMGLSETTPSQRRPASFRQAQKQGTEGRRDQVHAETTLLDGSEAIFTLILTEMKKLGWDDSRLKAFLRSRTGPNQGRETIRTLADANRVHWALKRLAARSTRTPSASPSPEAQHATSAV